MAGIFKAYDIRGTYPHQVNADMAHRLGLALATMFKHGTVCVGQDARVSSPEVAWSLMKGLVEGGLDVEDIGIVTTPCLNYCVGRFGYVGGVMVTASHNPPRYNGFKIAREGAVPMSYETGIKELENMVNNAWLCKAQTPGKRSKADLRKYYIEHVVTFSKITKKLNVVIDSSNGVGGRVFPAIFRRIPPKLSRLHFKIDGRFPNHDPNPLLDENIEDLQKVVVAKKADVGICLDGDADRMMAVDENGRRIACDLMTALIAREMLKDNPGAKFVYDVRSSRVVREEIENNGGEAIVERVGHSYMKAALREKDALFGGEVSGHFYFQKNFCCDSAAIATVWLLNLMSAFDGPISKLVEPLRRYHSTGEVNFKVEDSDEALEKLAKKFSDGKQHWLDGLTVDYPDW